MKRSMQQEISRPLRVAYFAGSMQPGQDGVTRVLFRLIDALHGRGVAHVFFSPLIPPEQERPTAMHRVPSVALPFYTEYRFACPGSRHFEAQLRAFDPDLLHINSPCPLGYAAVHYGQMHGIPVVATYHTHFTSYAKYYQVKALEIAGWSYLRKLYNGCERVYVPSEPILQELKDHRIRNLSFLPHGVDAETFNPRFRSQTWKAEHGIAGKQALLYAGRLVWEKDLRTLAQAYDMLMAKRDDCVFVLAGDGPVRQELEQMMPKALFLGYQSGEALSTAYASSDVFVFPSTTETFGNVTLEAMASGLPPVCVREGGAYGSIQEGLTGYVAAPGDPADFVAKIELLLDDPGRKAAIAERALTYARQQTWEQIFDRLFQGYREVIRNYAQRPMRHRRKAA